MKKKSETLANFKILQKHIELQFGKQTKEFRTDGGGEYVSHVFSTFMHEKGMEKGKQIQPYTPHQSHSKMELN